MARIRSFAIEGILVQEIHLATVIGGHELYLITRMAVLLWLTAYPMSRPEARRQRTD